MVLFGLIKRGYGSLSELKSLDTKEFLDIIEYENIQSDLELLHMEGLK